MSRAEITSEINDLVKQGNVRDAYAKFEELPVIDQIGISLSPGVGDALAVYEVGEFGQRAKESFKEGRTLGGLGYSALSGLSGASLFPLFRILRGGRGAAKALTKTAEDTLDVTPVKEVAPAVTSPVQQLPPDVRSARRVGPKKPKPPKPIPYDKFEPVEIISELDYPGTRYGTLTKGLISGARVALNTENLPNELPLNQWTKKLLGFGNVKKSELQALDFIDELGNPHPKAIEYFSDLLGTTNRGADAPISKKGIDNYLSERQTSLFDIRRAPESEWPGGSTIEGANEEIQKVYRARGILSGAGRTGDDHFNKYYENVALFDYTTEVFPKQFSRVLKEYATDSSFSISTILDDPRISMQFTSNELLELQTKAPSVIPELYAKFVRAHKKLGIPEVSEIADFAKQIDEVSLDRVNRELSDSYVSIKRAQSDYAEDIAKGKGYFDMSSYKERGLSWPTFLEDNMKDPITGEFKLVSERFLSIDDTIKRRNTLVKVLMDLKNETPRKDLNAPKLTDMRSRIAKEIDEIDTALMDESISPDGVLDFNTFDSGAFFRSKEGVSQILQELRQDFLSRTPTQRRSLMMQRYDRMEKLKDLPYDAKNKLARDVTLLQYMRGALDPRYVKAAKLYPSELKPSSVTPKAKSVDLPDVDAPYKKDFFENKGRPVLNPLALRKNVLDAVAEGKAGIHIDYMQPVKEGGDNEIVMAQYKEMTKTLRKILQELKVKDDVFELSMPNTGNFEDSGKFAFAGDTDVGAGAYYTFTPEFLAAVKEKGINAFVDGGVVDNDLPNVQPVRDTTTINGKEYVEFPPELIPYLPPGSAYAMGRGSEGKYYALPEHYDAFVDEANFQKRTGEYEAGGRGRNDPDVKFGGNPAYDSGANYSGTDIERRGRTTVPDGSSAQDPQVYRYQNYETHNLIANPGYASGDPAQAGASYQPYSDTMIIPGKDVYGEKIQKEIESHETAHRTTGYNRYSKDYSNKSINNLDSGENEHLYIASKVNKDPEQLEYYRKKYFSMMPKKMFDIYYKAVEKYYDNKYAIESDPNYPTGKAIGGPVSIDNMLSAL